MAKQRSRFVCQQCQYNTVKILGRCPECQAWNSFIEEIEAPEIASKHKKSTPSQESSPQKLNEIQQEQAGRIRTGIQELDHLLGSGIVHRSVILLGGEPGIGKSTLVLQILQKLDQQGLKCFYLSGEESLSQIQLRAQRLGIRSDNILIMSENNLSAALKYISKEKPHFLIADSIQTLYLPELNSAPGSVSQVRECASELLHYTKNNSLSTCIIGQVTKEGSIAGPKVLEHLVDTVLYFENDRGQNYRILRTFKNRFGATHEMAVFEMKKEGLIEVSNPSEIFLSHSKEKQAGSVVLSSLEGSRPILAELQALLLESNFANPKRVTLGVDSNRVSLIAAVLEKLGGFYLSKYDIFINVVGGLNLTEPAADLGLLMAMASSIRNQTIEPGTLVIGEVGLSGEVRPVHGINLRLAEARKLGFKTIILPKNNHQDLEKSRADEQDIDEFKIITVENIQEALEFLG